MASLKSHDFAFRGARRARGACGTCGMAAAILAAWSLLVLVWCALPAPAFADAYTMPHVRVAATVQPDGTLAVTESRTFSFDDDVNGVYWTIPAMKNEQGMPSRVLSIDGVAAHDGAKSIAFQAVTTAENGADGVYSVEETSDGTRVKLYHPSADGDELTASVRYTLAGAVMAWPDTAELYWQFVGPSWAEDSEDVSLSVTIADAAPASGAQAGSSQQTGEAAAAGDLRAWAHGPLDGTIAVNGAAAEVTATAPRVRAGQFAEVRATFPRAWVPQLAVPADAATTERLPEVLTQERAWAEEANAQRERARAVAIGLAVVQVALPAAFLAAVGAAKLRHRKPHPVFQETYFRDVPSADHPAVLAAFMKGGDGGDQAVVSTLMKLTDDGVIGLASERREKRGLLRTRTEEDYRLTVRRDRLDAVTDSIDRAALAMYFIGCSWEDERDERDGEPLAARTFDELTAYAKAHTKRYGAAVEEYQTTVKARLEERDLVASTGAGAAIASLVVAALCIIGEVLALAATDGASATVTAAIIGGVLALIAGALGCTFRRLTQEGAELEARCRALKKWLEDFTRLGEAVPGDVVLWNKLLVMAVALGVSENVLRELADAVPPEVRGDDATGAYFYPVYWWCYPHAGHAAPVASLHTAYAATISELAGSATSSAGGFGGGFSSGGGGGVGGGGGGTF